MLEWILTDNNLLIFESIMIVILVVIFVVIFLTALSSFEDDSESETRGKFACLLITIWAFLLFSLLYIDKHVVTENVAEGDWVQIYSNDQKADISIYFSPTSYIKAGEKLDNYQLSKLTALYSRNEIEDVAVAASKDGAEERRVVNLDGRNISIPREIPLDKDYYSSMKITKIEYQKISGQRKTLFDHHGNVTSSTVDGQIKITVEEEKSDQSLKELFDGKKQ